MDKIVNLNARKHIYDIDNCSGCQKVIDGEYTELGLPNGDNTEVRHIALCPKCSDVAKGQGAF